MNMWDYSNILMGSRTGANWGAGISDAAQSITRGVADYRREKKKKEQDEAAVEFLKKNGARFGINVLDEGEIKAAVKAAGGGQQAFSLLSTIQDMEQRKQAHEAQQLLAKSQMQQMENARQTEAREREAVASALRPRQRTAAEGLYVAKDATRDPTAEEVFTGYLRGGGSPKNVGGLVDAITTMDRLRDGKEDFAPKLFDLGGGVTAMSTSKKSAVPVAKGEAAAKPFSPAGKLIADADALEKAGRKDDAELLRKIAGKQGDEKPMTLTDYLISGGSPEDYRSYVESLRSGGTAGGKAAPASADKSGEPVTIKSKEDFDKLKPGTRFSYNGRIGIKK